jgi:tRNA nucleotidyltransferase (CCA-adding enzyme)
VRRCYAARVTARVDAAAIPKDVALICRELSRHGYKGWVVGGCLRDLLRGQPAADWDVATSARPEQVQKVFSRVIPTGIQHGTVTVRLGGNGYELTTLRGEGAYSDGRRPDSVEFVDDIAADLARRDFTVNAMAYDPIEQALIDPFGGLGDLDARLIRAVGRAEERFSEDGLRVLRAARFAATLEFEIEAATEAAIRPTLDTFRKVSAERVRDEWLKALKARAPSRAFAVMARTGILEATCPFLAALPEGELSAALRALDASACELGLRMAALLSSWWDDPGALDDWLGRYRFSNQERELIGSLVRHHRTPWGEPPDHAGLRRFAARVRRESVAGILDVSLRVAEARGDARAVSHAQRWRTELAAALTPTAALTGKELAIGGRDLMSELQLAPGPRLGKLLDALLDRVLDEPALNTRESLLALARDVAAES